MLREKIFFVLLCCFQTVLNAQSNVVSSGADATGSGGSVSFSIGQIDYTNQQTASGHVNQGVQQPVEIYHTNGLSNNDAITVSIGPNPTDGLILIQCDATLIENGGVALLYDNNGKMVYKNELVDVQTNIDLSAFTRGVYSLQISVANMPLSSFKIVKN
jgi:hypothetical protein